MKMKVVFQPLDWIVIGLNVLVFILQVFMPEGKSSVTAFCIFTLVLSVIIFETYQAHGAVKSLIFASSKLILYAAAIIVLLIKGGYSFVLTPLNILMIVLSLIGIGIRSFLRNIHTNKKAEILVWIQTIAVLPGAVSYCVAIVKHPHDYGIYSLVFWLINLLAYAIALWQLHQRKEPRLAYIFPVSGCVLLSMYVIFIYCFAI